MGIINLKSKKHPNKSVLVDDEDFIMLNQFVWYYSLGYAICSQKIAGKFTTLKMHRLLLNLINNQKKQVDHIDGNPLNNQKSNLRISTQSQNLANAKKRQSKNKKPTSNYKGIYWDKQMKKWRANIQYQKKGIFLGLYDNEIKAAYAYDEGAKKYFGQFARINFIKNENTTT